MTSRVLIIFSTILIYCCCLFALPLFSLATIDPKSVQKIWVNRMSECEYFGGDMSASDDTVVKGGSPGCWGSVAYIFTRDDNSCWYQQASLKSADLGVGNAVSLSGDTVAVGVGDSGYSSEAVLIFVRSGTSWSQQAKLIIPDTSWIYDLSLSGDTLAVRANNAVYIFVRSGTSWSQQAKLSMPDTNWLGDVSLSGDTVAVRASHGDYPDRTEAVHIFVRSGTSWSQQAKLSIPDISNLSEDADSVSLSGDTVAVSVGDPGYSEAVLIFVRSGTSWSQQAQLIIPDTHWISELSLSGDTVAVSAVSAFGNGNDDNAVYIFARSGTSWSQQTKFAVHDYPNDISTSENAVFFTGDEYREDPFGVESFLYIYSDDVCIQKNALPAIIMQLLNSRK